MCRKNPLHLRMIVYLFLTVTGSLAQSPPEDPTKGSRLFANKGCSRCHALKGEGGKIGPTSVE
jgi:cytochrome c2